MEVLTTTDYKRFKIPKYSRPLAMNVVNKEVDWVNQPKDGRLRRLIHVELKMRSRPVQVNRDMEILEGKHRFEILRLLERPVDYIIVERVI